MSIKKSQDLSDFSSWMEGTTPLEFPKTDPEFGKKTKQYQQARIHAQEERTLSPRMQDVLQENLSDIAPAIFSVCVQENYAISRPLICMAWKCKRH